MKSRIRLAIVDPSEIVRAAIRTLVRDCAQVVATTESLEGLLRVDDEVDVVVADLSACTGPWREALARVRQRWPSARLILTTVEEDREYEDAALSLRADGWIPKHQLGRRLPEEIRRATGARI